MVSKASDDLPEPESPVMTTSLFRGSSTSMFLRLCSRAFDDDLVHGSCLLRLEPLRRCGCYGHTVGAGIAWTFGDYNGEPCGCGGEVWSSSLAQPRWLALGATEAMGPGLRQGLGLRIRTGRQRRPARDGTRAAALGRALADVDEAVDEPVQAAGDQRADEGRDKAIDAHA